MSGERILVSWVSFNNDPFERERDGSFRQGAIPGPALELLSNEASRYYGKIEHAYFFVRATDRPDGKPRAVHPLETDVLKSLLAELRERAPSVKCEPVLWKTGEPPTAYRPIFDFTATHLRQIRRRHPKATLVVNLSSGTPQMQTVMLLALQARLGGDSVEAVQGIPRDKRRKPDQLHESVPWNLLAELNARDSTSDEGEAPKAWTLASAKSDALRKVCEQIALAGPAPFPVLILGGRGTGKTRIAEAIRSRFLDARSRAGAGSAGQWPHRLNCADLGGALLESELFGHEKGAFTGAIKAKSGLLELASGDCLLLDEIHHMSKETQAKLLLALERNGHFRRVGGTKTIPAEFRLIAASNRTRSELRRDLDADFFDRTADLVITVPDLRDCREDLPEMWRAASVEACDDLATSLRLDRAALNAMRGAMSEHHGKVVRDLLGLRLPGNWRDLQRLARRLVTRGLVAGTAGAFNLDDARVTSSLAEMADEERDMAAAEAIDLSAALPSSGSCVRAMREALGADEIVPLLDLTTEWERRLIEAAIQAAGTERKAAPLLDVPSRTLNRRRKLLRNGR